MYIELFTKTRAYRGSLIRRVNNTIVLKDLQAESVFILELDFEHTLYNYAVRSEYFDYTLEHIISAKSEKIFTSEDISLIINSYDVVKNYRIIHSLRSLGFKFNTLEEIKLPSLVKNLKNITKKEHAVNKAYINTDTDLTLIEKNNLINTINRAKTVYYSKLRKATNIIEALDDFPPMFNETLSYISDIIYYIKRYDEESANITRSADTQA